MFSGLLFYEGSDGYAEFYRTSNGTSLPRVYSDMKEVLPKSFFTTPLQVRSRPTW